MQRPTVLGSVIEVPHCSHVMHTLACSTPMQSFSILLDSSVLHLIGSVHYILIRVSSLLYLAAIAAVPPKQVTKMQ